jgi:hypothetical protein
MTRLVARLTALGLAGVLAVATLAPASAATRKHHHAAPAHIGQMDDGIVTAPVAAAPAYMMPSAPGFGPNACVSDEGYGRFTSCDAGTSN